MWLAFTSSAACAVTRRELTARELTTPRQNRALPRRVEADNLIAMDLIKVSRCGANWRDSENSVAKRLEGPDYSKRHPRVHEERGCDVDPSTTGDSRKKAAFIPCPRAPQAARRPAVPPPRLHPPGSSPTPFPPKPFPRYRHDTRAFGPRTWRGRRRR